MSETYFVRKKKKDNFSIIENTCLRDNRLSYKAKGLHTVLESLPDDWEIHLSDLEKRSRDGKDSLNSAIKELEKYGYFHRVQTRSENGKFGGYSYYVYENPNENPYFSNCDERKQNSALVNDSFDSASELKATEIKTPKLENPEAEKPLSENPKTANPLSENPEAEKPLSENPQLLNTEKLKTEKLIIQPPKTNLTNCVAKEKTNFQENIKILFDGQYPFDKNFESEVISKSESAGLSEEKIKEFLTYVFEQTSQKNVKKSFTGLFRTLALSDSVINDFIQIREHKGTRNGFQWNKQFHQETSQEYADMVRDCLVNQNK